MCNFLGFQLYLRISYDAPYFDQALDSKSSIPSPSTSKAVAQGASIWQKLSGWRQTLEFIYLSEFFVSVWELRGFLTSMSAQRGIFKDFFKKIYFIQYFSCLGGVGKLFWLSNLLLETEVIKLVYF